jgi:glycosyltransferase involved in cell wall biosynthesis
MPTLSSIAAAAPLRSPRPPVRVAIVAPSMAILGGQAVQAERLLAAWAGDPDVRAWLVPVNPVPIWPLRLLTRVRFARTLAVQAAYWPLLVRELRRADVVHVFSASYFSFLLAPLPAVLVARLLGKPVVMNYRSGQAPDHLARSAVARAVLRHVDRNVVPSTFLQDVFGRFGITAEVVPNIVDLERFAFRPRPVLRPRLLSTRNFEGLYNVSCTLDAFARVQARFSDATLTLVGSGSEEGALRRQAERLGLRGVTFAGRVAPDQIWRCYADADIYVQTPDIDNMPSSVLEAFASGCAVVSTDAGGVPAILTDSVHGLLVPRGDHEAVADRVVQLLEQPELAASLTRTARESCERYRWTAVRGAWLEIYRHLMGSARGAHRAEPAPRLSA